MAIIFTEIKDVITDIETAFAAKSNLKQQEHKVIWARRMISEIYDLNEAHPGIYDDSELESLAKIESDIAKIDELVRRSNAFIRRYNLTATMTMEVTL